MSTCLAHLLLGLLTLPSFVLSKNRAAWRECSTLEAKMDCTELLACPVLQECFHDSVTGTAF